MTTRKTSAPAEKLAAGEIHVAAPALSPVDERVQHVRTNLIRGAAILDLPPRRWIVPDWLPLDACVVIYGDPKAGKSLYAWNLALELASGGRWLGPLPRPYRVLWIAAEKIADLPDRSRAWSTEKPLPDRLIIANHRPNLTGQIDVAAYERIITDEKIDIVIIDTYAAATAGVDENSAEKTGVVMAHLDQLRRATSGGCVIAIHHSSKNATKGNAAALRGSTAFLGAVELTIEVSATSSGAIQAAVTATNCGATPLPEHYRIIPVPIAATAADDVARSAPRLEHTGAPIVSGTVIAKIVALWSEGGYFDGPASRKAIEDALLDSGEKISTASLNRHLGPATAAGILVKSGTESRPIYCPADRSLPGIIEAQ